MKKKWSLKWKKMMFEMKQMKFGETKNEKQMKNKWKINENKKMIEKQNEKNEVTNENPNEK